MNELSEFGCRIWVIVPDVTALAFAQIVNMREKQDFDLGRLDSDQFKGGNESSQLRQFVIFHHALKMFTRDEVVTRFRLT